MNRRQLITAGLGSVAGLLAAVPHVHSAAAPCYRCPGGAGYKPPVPPPPPPGEQTFTIPGLPPGLVAFEFADGDVLEVIVPASGSVTVTARTKFLLAGGPYEVVLPGGFLNGGGDAVVRNRTAIGEFLELTYSVYPAGGFFFLEWMYRHPFDYPGGGTISLLKGASNHQLLFGLSTLGEFTELPEMRVDLVDFDVSPPDVAALVAIPRNRPRVRSVIKTFTFPAGQGRRDFPLDPVEIPKTARCLGLQPRTDWMGPLELEIYSPSGNLELVPLS